MTHSEMKFPTIRSLLSRQTLVVLGALLVVGCSGCSMGEDWVRASVETQWLAAAHVVNGIALEAYDCSGVGGGGVGGAVWSFPESGLQHENATACPSQIPASGQSYVVLVKLVNFTKAPPEFECTELFVSGFGQSGACEQGLPTPNGPGTYFLCNVEQAESSPAGRSLCKATLNTQGDAMIGYHTGASASKALDVGSLGHERLRMNNEFCPQNTGTCYDVKLCTFSGADNHMMRISTWMLPVFAAVTIMLILE